ncbi:Lrp/AsnC family transcriptional regulator [Halothermothrix orenii]|uniref:Putative transcriptional regulator, AsnC family n=1 Tax=Halothermothrix orenii (strain H 168 / OCM 544 / DSM 9562) TaxID=373903 RepID=B8CZD9_HALOH|nr:Lrp/AsnC family transcriptional regulator [Halothermothrix orenii]ACL70658.1 putative transcriptional regulator, AsnC family [Halothermothrix orenii H 168]
MDELDYKLLDDLSKNSRVSYAELERKYNLSRVCIRERINNLVDEGVIENFTININPEKLGMRLEAFFELDVKPNYLYKVARELSEEDDVVHIFLMTGSATLHMYVVLKDKCSLEDFLREKLYNREEIIGVDCKIILKKFKSSNNILSKLCEEKSD